MMKKRVPFQRVGIVRAGAGFLGLSEQWEEIFLESKTQKKLKKRIADLAINQGGTAGVFSSLTAIILLSRMGRLFLFWRS